MEPGNEARECNAGVEPGNEARECNAGVEPGNKTSGEGQCCEWRLGTRLGEEGNARLWWEWSLGRTLGERAIKPLNPVCKRSYRQQTAK